MPADLAPLARLSARLGNDPEQVQAAGGNTSLKHDGILWVKASGLWLADAGERDIFVPVALESVRRAMADGRDDPIAGHVIAEHNPQALRPSIETSLHALMPHRHVVHTHSVRTIAFAVRSDADGELAARLDGLRWQKIAYFKPGLPLTRGVLAGLRQAPADILVLANHGLVVGADDLDTLERLLAEVEQRLDVPVRQMPAANSVACDEAQLRPVHHSRAHSLGRDRLVMQRALAGSLYPDHVIFLGPAARQPGGDAASKLTLVEGQGAFLPADAGRSADEMALCLALVLARVPDAARLAYLTAGEEAELLDWDAEKYRQSIAKA